MIKITSLQAIAGALLACGLSAAPAAALANRTFVSGKGTNSGACTRAAPCLTFAFALAQTAAAGEIDVLDPADYGKVTITKAISIVNDGAGTAGINAGPGGGPAVSIRAGASDSVHLRGLTIGVVGPETEGIAFESGGNLAIENCVIRNVPGAGISISGRTSSTFSVSNTISSNNGVGITVMPIGPAVVITGVLSKVITNNNSFGILVVPSNRGTSINVTIVDSEASNNGVGVTAGNPFGGQGRTAVMVRNVVASNNGTGLEADGVGNILRVGHSVVTGNATGVNKSDGATIFSYGDNDIDGNTNNNTGVLTSLAEH